MTANPPSVGYRDLLVLLAVILVSAFVGIGMTDAWGTGVDDADIFHVYAKNITSGHGFVFYPGGERVEGFTSFLWQMVYAVVVAIGLPVTWTLRCLSICVLALAYWEWVRAAAWLWPGQKPRVVPWAFWILVQPFLVFWSVTALMDAGLWASLWITAAACLMRRLGPHDPGYSPLFAFVLVLMPLSRPEGFAVAPLLWLMMFLIDWWGGTARFKVHASYLFPCVAVCCALTCFRLVVFGYPVPNTYYAKVSPAWIPNIVAGTGYLVRSLLFSPAVLVAFGLSLPFGVKLYRQGGTYRTALYVFVMLLGLAFGQPVLTGGDHFHGGRFFLPGVLLLGLPFGYGAVWFCRTSLRIWYGFGTGVLLLVLSWYALSRSNLHNEISLTGMNRSAGSCMRRVFEGPSAPTVGVIAAGGFTLQYGGPVFDLLGLNHQAMAHAGRASGGKRNHASFTPEIFFAHAPPVLLPELLPDNALPGRQGESFANRVLNGLLEDEGFLARYTSVDVRLPGLPSGNILRMYVERSWLLHSLQPLVAERNGSIVDWNSL